MGNSRGSEDTIDVTIGVNNRPFDVMTSTTSAQSSPSPVLRNVLTPSAKSTSISTISGLHSHRNVKPVHQMLLAESMFNPSLPLDLKCRLNPNLRQTLSDNNIFPYFLQFMESFEKKSKYWIRFYIQTECLIVSQRNVDSNTKSNHELRQQFINDSIRIYDKYLSDSSANCLLKTLDIRLDFPQEIKEEIEKNLLNKRSEISYDLFRKAQNYTIERIEKDYFESFLKSSYYCKYSVDLLTSGSVTLADILFNNSDLATNFIEFMESESMKTYIDFLIMFENYRKVSNDYDDAIALFNRFFGDSDHRLGFSDRLVLTLSEKLVKNNFNCDCLDTSAAILIQYFDKTYLKQFIESQFFVEYLNDLFHSIQSEVNYIKTHKSHKRTNSDSSYNSECSFVSSIGTRDGDNINANPQHRSSHLNDEQKSDNIWRRDLSGKLQFTYVDKYGRLSSCLEPEPDRNTGALSKVMKRFALNSTQDKDKEEIAWKIATMIVNDVNHICNGSNDGSNDTQE